MFEDNDLDLGKVMKTYARMNPHISMSDIAFLMDMPYSPDFDSEYTGIDSDEEIQPGY